MNRAASPVASGGEHLGRVQNGGFVGKRVGQESCKQKKRKDDSGQGHFPLGGRAGVLSCS